MTVAASVLYLLCGALFLPYIFSATLSPPCPEYACRCMYNTTWTTDSDGCTICSCTNQYIYCPKLTCLNECPNGFQNDENGCQTCACNKPICPEISCPSPKTCESEFFKDEEGCLKCKCKSNCKEISCPTIKCGYGYATDSEGCPYCQCKTSP